MFIFLKQNSRRLLLPFFLTCLGLTLTYVYDLISPKFLRAYTAAPIAIVSSLDGLHYSKRQGSSLWSPLQEGDYVYADDILKTSDDGVLTVQFFNEGLSLEIEPNSLMNFKNIENRISLGLTEGYATALATNQIKKDKYYLILNGGEQIIASGSTPVFKNDKNLIVANNSLSLNVKNPLQIEWKSPLTDFEIESNPDDPTPCTLQWSGVTGANKIAIEWGPTRKKLTTRVFAAVDSLTLQTILPIGKNYWRWSIYKADETELIWASPTAKAIVTGQFAPAIVTPLSGNVIRYKENESNIEFKWIPQNKFDQYQIEIAQNSDMKNPIQKSELSATSISFQKPLRVGKYFWRIAGQDIKSKKLIRSKINNFQVLVKDQEHTQIKWITQDHAVFNYLTLKPTIQLAWLADQTKYVQRYRILISNNGNDFKLAESFLSEKSELKVGLENAGLLMAVIEALNYESEIIGRSPPLNFELKKIVRLRAPTSEYSGKTLSADDKGQITLYWNPVKDAKNYQLHMQAPSGEKITLSTTKPSYSFQKLRPGLYEIEIYASDSQGQLSEGSELIRVLVSNRSSVRPIKLKKVQVQ